MIRFRSFRNTDPPLLARLWQSQPATRGLYSRVTAPLLEHLVFSKIYFEAAGLIVAEQGGEIRGFAHAGFGCTEDGQRMDYSRGTTAMLMVAPGEDAQSVALELLHYSERYLLERGARELYGGQLWPLNPFYLGLYGGSQLAGVLESDTRQSSWFAAAGYEPAAHRVVLQRLLANFRPPMNRDLLLLRRRLRVEQVDDPATSDWWTACQYAQHEQLGLRLVGSDSSIAARLSLWNMEPLASGWGVHAAGITDWKLAESEPGSPLELFLLAETLRLLQSQGVMLAEVQRSPDDTQTLGVLNELGFQTVDRGVLLRKPMP